jgi:hypothetical protein
MYPDQKWTSRHPAIRYLNEEKRLAKFPMFVRGRLYPPQNECRPETVGSKSDGDYRRRMRNKPPFPARGSVPSRTKTFNFFLDQICVSSDLNNSGGSRTDKIAMLFEELGESVAMVCIVPNDFEIL